MRILTRIRAIVVALLMVLVGVVATASPAAAWTPDVSGTVICDTETGLFDVTWTIGNSENETMHYETNRPGVPAGSVPADDSVTFTEQDLQAGSYTLTVNAAWENSYEKKSKSATVTTVDECEKPDEKVTPAGFSVAPPTCDTVGVGTIPEQPEGVDVTPAPGNYGPDSYEVVFTAEEGYELSSNPSGTMTVLPATGYQSDNPDEPCYEEPEVPEEPEEPNEPEEPEVAGEQAADIESPPAKAPAPAPAGTSPVPTAVDAGI